MKKNMGSTDKIIRIIIAVIVNALYFTGIISGILGLVLLIASGVFILTSFISFCPLYTALGINTCRIKDKL